MKATYTPAPKVIQPPSTVTITLTEREARILRAWMGGSNGQKVAKSINKNTTRYFVEPLTTSEAADFAYNLFRVLNDIEVFHEIS